MAIEDIASGMAIGSTRRSTPPVGLSESFERFTYEQAFERYTGSKVLRGRRTRSSRWRGDWESVLRRVCCRTIATAG